MDCRADLHVHTTASDGALKPTQVVEAAAQMGLAAVGIADHDTVDGVAEALAAGDRLGIEVVPAIEISAVHNETEVHILGYFIDHEHPELLEQMRILKEGREERGRLMVEKLNAIGVKVDFERVREIAQGGAVGRPHVARAICEIGAASSIDAAFGRFLQVGAPAYVPRIKVSPVQAVELVTKVGGVACCAHVGKLKRDDLVLELTKHGLAAIEVYHPDHSKAISRFYLRFAERLGLIATGGSDAHCIPGKLSIGIGGVTVDYSIVSRLKSQAHGRSATLPKR
ncbi:MAG: PHP domain-containing protein [Armatimonadetes bacterium]|nr:PHP domain-containing protein [Armatimonadota bacterium]